MNIKERLNKHNYNKKQLEHIKLEIEKVKREYQGVTGVAIGSAGGKGTNKISSRTESEALRKLEELRKLEDKAFDYEIQIKQIENALGVLTEKERITIEIVYFQNKNLFAVVDEIGGSYRNVLRIHKVALEKLESIL